MVVMEAVTGLLLGLVELVARHQEGLLRILLEPLVEMVAQVV
jgi:hypothetical protein